MFPYEGEDETDEIDPNSYEHILGHHEALANSREYLVKIAGRSYRKSRWIEEEQLKTSNRGCVLLSRYNHFINSQKSEPPFYDEKYDIPDYIIAEKDGSYLVKWMHLFHEQATWESRVDPALVEAWREREGLHYPGPDDEIYYEEGEFKKIDYYRLNAQELRPRAIMSMNYLLACWYRRADAKLSDSMRFDHRIYCIAFLHFLMSELSQCGPFMILVNQRSLNNWYDALSECTDMATLLYAGPRSNIRLINEIDFEKEDGKLRFNVLLTTVDVLSQEIGRLRAITWKTMIMTDVPAQVSTDSRLMRLTTQIRTQFKVVITSSDPLSAGRTVCSFANAFTSEPSKEVLDPKMVSMLQEIKNLMQRSFNTPPKAVKVSVDCPMCQTQRTMCRQAIYAQENNVKQGKFDLLVRLISGICSHPYIMPEARSLFPGKGLREVSTKGDVVGAILERELVKGRTVLITTIRPIVQDLIDDYLSESRISFCRMDQLTEAPVQVVTHCTLSDFEIPAHRFGVIIIYDGTYEELSSKRNLETVEQIYQLECVDYRECEMNEALKTNNDRLDMLCRNSVFHLVTDDLEIDPDELIENAIEISEVVSGNGTSMFAEREFTSDDFWNVFYRQERTECVEADIDIVIDDSFVWTVAQRNMFIRALFAFGWNSYEKVMNWTGLKIDSGYFQALSCALIELVMAYATCKSFSYSIVSSIVKAAKTEDMNLDPGVVGKGFFDDEQMHNQLKSSADLLLRRLVCLHFIHSLAETADQFIEDLPIHGDSPSSWWTTDHDRALVNGVCNYGLDNYEYFYTDDDALIREIANLSRACITKRLCILSDASLEFFMSSNSELQIVDEQLESQWRKEEIQIVLQRLEKFGIEIDRSGSYDFVSFAAHFNIPSRTPDQIKELVEALIARCQHPDSGVGVSINAALRLTQRIDGMTHLQMLFMGHSSDEMVQIFDKAPRWTAMPDTWTCEIESEMFAQILTLGLGSLVDIFSRDPFITVFGGEIPDFVQQDICIIKRISVVFDYVSSHGLIYDSIRRGIMTKKSSSSQVFTGEISASSIEYPVMVTPTSLIHNIGTIDYERRGFHTERYIYPVGFKSSRISAALGNPDEKARWFSEIVDVGEEYPIFRVWMEDKPNTVFQGMTPTAPWSQALKAVANSRKVKGRVASISGPEAFLLASPIATYLVQNLPNAEKCTSYVMRNVDSNPLVKKLIEKPLEEPTEETH